VPSTKLATAYFDGISYQKGSAILKQLLFLMGEGNFFSGLQDYFQNLQWSNSTIDDLLASMGKFFDNPSIALSEWNQMWLLLPSLNVLTVDWDPNSISATSTLTIHQGFYTPDYETLRYQKIDVAFFKIDGSFDLQTV
jgi:aminopeptidase N